MKKTPKTQTARKVTSIRKKTAPAANNHLHLVNTFIQQNAPAIISLFLMLLIFTSRLSLSIKSISLVTSLILILFTVSPQEVFKTYCHHPIARAAVLFYGCLIIGSLYGHAPFVEKIHALKNYLPLLWIGLFITFFQTSYPRLSSRFTKDKAKTYSSIFIYGVVLVTFLGCLNAWHIVNVSGLVHSHPTTDPAEYPFGTFSFSLSFAAYLSIQKVRYALDNKTKCCYLACFIFLSFFIFFMSHQRTAYILYLFLLLLYGYQYARLKGVALTSIFLALLVSSAFFSSPTFKTRTLAAMHDVQIYKHGDPVSSTGLRISFLKESYHLWKKKPLFGYGTGSFKNAYLTLDGYNINGQKNTPESALDQPHSDYAYIIVQLGLFGFITFMWLLSKQFFLSFQLPAFEKQCAQAFILSFMIGSLDTTLMFYATSLTDYFFFSALFYAPIYASSRKE